jgi:hypothetical protein
MATVKVGSFVVALLGICCLAVSLNASHEVITCKSPDGKFALRHVHADQQPYAGDTMIIEVATGKTVLPLDSDWSIGDLELVVARFPKSRLFCEEREQLLDPSVFPERFVVQ